MYGNMVQNDVDPASNSDIQRFSHLDTSTTCITIPVTTNTRSFDTIVDANQVDSHTFTQQSVYRFNISFDTGCFNGFDAIQCVRNLIAYGNNLVDVTWYTKGSEQGLHSFVAFEGPGFGYSLVWFSLLKVSFCFVSFLFTSLSFSLCN